MEWCQVFRHIATPAYAQQSLSLYSIGLIYDGYQYDPTFWTAWELFPTFQDEHLLLLAVNRGDLRKLNYNKTIFGRDSAPDPTERAHNALLDPE